jgi:steroid delta-isomerase-like uncharacterized protein
LPVDAERTINMSDAASAGQAFIDALEKRDFDAMGECLAEEVTFNDAPRGQVINGRAAVRDWYTAWLDACPDAVIGATLASASNDTAVFEGVFAGTNTGPLGPYAATGRPVSVPYVNVFRFDATGRIVRGSGYYDQLSLMVQLGHMEAPTAGS